MKRLVGILLLLFVVSATILHVAESFHSRWEPRFRHFVEARAGKILKSNVHIDSISLVFFPFRLDKGWHQIRLNDVRVDDPEDPARPMFRASRIALTISLIDLPRAVLHRHPAESIGLVSVDNPSLVL